MGAVLAFAAAVALMSGVAQGQEAVAETGIVKHRDRSLRRDAFSRNIPVPVRVPSEFGKLSAVLLSANELVHFHPQLFAELVEAISERAPVVAIVAGPEQALNGREALETAGVPRSKVHFLTYPLDSMWIRDFGPVFMRRSDGSAFVIDTYYRARDEVGDRALDDQFPLILAQALDLSTAYVPIALEGGNFIHNGQGLSISTLTLVERNRYRNIGGGEFSRLMSAYFALKTFVLVPALPGEPTGHVDMFMSFAGPRTLIVAQADPSEDPETAVVLDRAAELALEQTVDGRPVEVLRIPLPPRLGHYWRSYTNVFYVNGLLLVPSYSDVDPALESVVFDTYRQALPGWEVRAIPADDLVKVGGFLHCLTLGLPHFVDPTPIMELAEVDSED